MPPRQPAITTTRRIAYYTVLILVSFLLAMMGTELLVRVLGLGPQVGRMEGAETALSLNPEVGWVRVPHVADRNEFGFRDDTFDDLSNDEIFQIVLLGDSVAEDSIHWSGPYQNAFPHLLESDLRRQGYNVRIYNLSVNGYNTLQEVEAFREFRAETGVQPDLVLLSYCLNDTAYVAADVLEALLKGHSRRGVAPETFGRRLLRFSAAYRLLYAYQSSKAADEPQDDELGEYTILTKDTVPEALERLKDDSSKEDFAVLAAIFPYHRPHFGPGVGIAATGPPLREAGVDYADGYPFENLHTTAQQRMENAGIDYVDLKRTFRQCLLENPDQHPGRDVFHLSEVGHSCASAYLSKYLARNYEMPVLPEGETH